jgi:hypothetical protein
VSSWLVGPDLDDTAGFVIQPALRQNPDNFAIAAQL